MKANKGFFPFCLLKWSHSAENNFSTTKKVRNSEIVVWRQTGLFGLNNAESHSANSTWLQLKALRESFCQPKEERESYKSCLSSCKKWSQQRLKTQMTFFICFWLARKKKHATKRLSSKNCGPLCSTWDCWIAGFDCTTRVSSWTGQLLRNGTLNKRYQISYILSINTSASR